MRRFVVIRKKSVLTKNKPTFPNEEIEIRFIENVSNALHPLLDALAPRVQQTSLVQPELQRIFKDAVQLYHYDFEPLQKKGSV